MGEGWGKPSRVWRISRVCVCEECSGGLVAGEEREA